MKHLYDSENVLIAFSSIQEMCQGEMVACGRYRGGEGDGDWQNKWERENWKAAQMEQEKIQTFNREDDSRERGYVKLLIRSLKISDQFSESA